MYKCHNINTTVKGTLTTGGLVGLITGEIKECSNKGIVIGNVGGNITLFKLNEKENEMIDLTIINYSYIENRGKLIKMNEDNQFCIQCDDYLLIY